MKRKNLKYLRDFARSSDFIEIFDPQGIHRVNWEFFLKIVLPPLLVASFFTPRVSTVNSEFFPKIVFPPFFAAILNFCVKCRIGFISETVRYRVNLTKFLTPRVLQFLWAKFLDSHLGIQFFALQNKNIAD